MPIFVLVVVITGAGLSLGLLLLAIIAGLGLGLMAGHFMTKAVIRQLLTGESNFFVRRAPGGIWFFVGLGVLGVVVAATLLNVPGGVLVLKTSSAVLGSIMIVTFTFIGVKVWRIERAYGASVLMGSEGLSFDSDEQ